jgi:hypothetical protein
VTNNCPGLSPGCHDQVATWRRGHRPGHHGEVSAEPASMNTASKLGPHTQTDRGTCPGVGL